MKRYISGKIVKASSLIKKNYVQASAMDDLPADLVKLPNEFVINFRQNEWTCYNVGVIPLGDSGRGDWTDSATKVNYSLIAYAPGEDAFEHKNREVQYALEDYLTDLLNGTEHTFSIDHCEQVYDSSVTPRYEVAYEIWVTIQ